MRFAGYAALFDKRDDGRDVIRRGAFVRTLDERQEPLPLFWQHRPEMRIGWVERIAEDAKGLRVIASIDNPEGGAAAALKQGTTNGLSFGYRARGYLRDAAGRELTDIDLYEVSLVSHPMQHAARVHQVSLGEQKFNQRHYREDGQFARAGEGVLYGGGTARSGLAPRAPGSTPASANARTAISNGASDETSLPQRDIVVIGDKDRQLRDDFDATFAPLGEAGRSGEQQQGGIRANAPRNPSRTYRLGILSKLHESGQSGPETVSSGRNDAGGVSYGLYQFTSRFPVYERGKIVGYNVGGTVRTFLNSPEGSPWRTEFADLTPGIVNFSDAWKRVARTNANQFGEAQHAFIKRTHYESAVNGVLKTTGLNLDSRSDAIRNVAWSVSVQHAKAVGILKRAVAKTDKSMHRTNSNYDRILINNIYDERSLYVLNNVQPKSTARSIVSRRYADERNDALQMLSGTYRPQ